MTSYKNWTLTKLKKEVEELEKYNHVDNLYQINLEIKKRLGKVAKK